MTTLPPKSTIGNFPYTIVRPLSKPSQSMSEVYLATVGKATSLQSYPPQVVLKIARAQRNQHNQFVHDALDNEVERLRRLRHFGIVRVLPIQHTNLRNLVYFAQSELEGNPWFSVMEYLQGGSLDDLIAKRKGLELGLALEITRSLAATLDYLHSRQQVHMDIKAENVLFRFEPMRIGRVEPVFIDFGIARYIGQDGMSARTLPYASPERLLPEQNPLPPELAGAPHPAMDIWSLGVMFYLMVTGQMPFRGRDAKSTASAIINNDPTPPSNYRPQLPKDIEQLLLYTLSKEPSRRPTAEELTVELEKATIKLDAKWIYFPPGPGNEEKSNPPVPDPSLPIKPPRGAGVTFWSRLLIALAFAELLVIGLLIGYLFRSAAPPPLPAQTPPTVTLATATASSVPGVAAVITNTTTVETATATATPALTDLPATPTEIAMSTATPVPTETPLPTATPIPTATATPIPTPTFTAPVALAPPIYVTRVTLRTPPDGASVPGRQTYCWEPNGTLPPDSAYEVAIWKSIHDWNKEVEAQGIHGAITAPTEAGWCIVEVDVSRLIDEGAIGNINKNEMVRWGVFVRTGASRRYLQVQHNITFE